MTASGTHGGHGDTDVHLGSHGWPAVGALDPEVGRRSGWHSHPEYVAIDGRDRGPGEAEQAGEHTWRRRNISARSSDVAEPIHVEIESVAERTCRCR